MKRSKHSGTILARDVLKTARLSLQSVHKSQNLMRPTDAHSVQPIAAQSWQLIMHAVVVGVQLQCSEPVLRWRCHRIMVRRMLWHTHTHTHTCTLYRNMFGTCLHFPSSAENWRPFCSGRHSMMRSNNALCFICAPVAQCWSVTMYWLLQTDFFDIAWWSCSSSAIMPPK